VRQLDGIEDGLDRLLLGRVDEAARVDDDEVRSILCSEAVTGGQQARCERVGVGLVLGAAQRVDEEGADRGGPQR
jgi:hypothetical protein